MDVRDQPPRVNLELQIDPDAIHGTLQHHDGTRERFWGWLELMSAVDRAASENRQRNGSHPVGREEGGKKQGNE